MELATTLYKAFANSDALLNANGLLKMIEVSNNTNRLSTGLPFTALYLEVELGSTFNVLTGILARVINKLQ